MTAPYDNAIWLHSSMTRMSENGTINVGTDKISIEEYAIIIIIDAITEDINEGHATR